VVKYLPTSEFARKGDYYQSDLRFKSTSLIKKMADLVERAQNAISEIDAFEWKTKTAADVCAHIEACLIPKEKFKLDFFQFGHEWASKKKKYSASNYHVALNSFSKFLDTEVLDISEITSSLLRKYEIYLHEKHGRDARAVSLYTSHISTIHSEARKRYNDEELGEVRIKNPYEYYKPPKQKPAKKVSLTKTEIQKLINIRHSLSKYDKLAVDIFLLSFITMGSNIPDLYCAEFDKPGIIHYQRTKTKERRSDGADMYIRLEPVTKCLYQEYLDPTGKKAFNLHNMYTFYKSIADKGNDRLKNVAKAAGINKPFTMRWARRSFGTIANSFGIEKSITNDMLCHIDPNMVVTDIYIEKDWTILWKANRKVLKRFEWK
jgi:site-specific recombinase XerD